MALAKQVVLSTMYSSMLTLLLFAGTVPATLSPYDDYRLLINFSMGGVPGDPSITPPLRLRTPSHYQAGSSPAEIAEFANRMVWYHTYPDIQGYERTGNGFTAGDEGLWELAVCTDGAGQGTLLIEFPPLLNRIDMIPGKSYGLPDGLSHPHNAPKVQGFVSYVWPSVSDITFAEPQYAPYYRFVIPRSRSYAGFYLPFTAAPDECYDFGLKRHVIWDPPYSNDMGSPPGGSHGHDEL